GFWAMKRQRYSNEFKVQVVKEIEVGNRSAVARSIRLPINVLYRWIREYQQGRFDDGYQILPRGIRCDCGQQSA
ncbi:hypothetical protein CEN49_13365, partial [Fischerella thermalis CCMEE 5273]